MAKAIQQAERTYEGCTKAILPVRDALDILSGKWKLPIIIALSFGNRRFSQLAKQNTWYYRQNVIKRIERTGDK
jgi:DNA-binding HxlR family transcriptional regulator